MDRRNTDRPAHSGERRPEHRNGPRADRGPRGGRPGAPRRPGSGAPRGAKKAPAAPKHTARDVALTAFREVTRKNAYASQALDRALTSAGLSDADRRLAAGIFYFTLENRLRIEHVLTGYTQTRPEPEIMEIMDIAAAQLLYMDRIPDHAAVDEAVKQTRAGGRESRTGLVNGVLRSLARDRDAGNLTLPDRDAEPAKFLSERYSVALPLAERLIEVYGLEAAEAMVAWTPDRRVTVLRPNRLRMTDAQFAESLTAQNLKWEHGIVPGAFRVFDAGNPAAMKSWRDGSMSIQGECSMLAAQAVEAKAGMQVLDACAAPGGKSCLMAEMMKGAGRVYAWELHDVRTELIKAAAKRLELDNIRPQTRDASVPVRGLGGTMDAVLVDAPCSGLGVMGEKPDIKYRLNMDTVTALIPIQEAILNACGEYVRPGGRLVYSTCTILPEENADRVRAFLDTHPDFEPDTDDRWLPECLRERFSGGMIQLLPGRDGLEGFFIARLRRKAETL